MRNLILAVATLLAATGAQAEQPCQSEYLSAEDVAIMASVMIGNDAASESRFVRNGRATILYSVRDAYGRVGPDDLAQMQSVQPEGAKVVYCLAGGSQRN